MLAVAAGAERMTQAMRSLEAAFLIGVEGVTEIWLVRHGDCYENMAEGPDPPLSALGRRFYGGAGFYAGVAADDCLQPQVVETEYGERVRTVNVCDYAD